MQNKVQAFRKSLHLTQEQLGKGVGVTRQTIISIENGKYIASLPLAIKIARFFSTTVENIFIIEEND